MNWIWFFFFFLIIKYGEGLNYAKKVLEITNDRYVKASARLAMGICYNNMSIQGKLIILFFNLFVEVLISFFSLHFHCIGLIFFPFVKSMRNGKLFMRWREIQLMEKKRDSIDGEEEFILIYFLINFSYVLYHSLLLLTIEPCFLKCLLIWNLHFILLF